VSVVRGRLPYLLDGQRGDNLLLLDDLLDELDARGVSGPLLLRASEREKLDKILTWGTDRAGYEGDRRWAEDPSIAHEDVILATTPDENRSGEAQPERSTSLRKFSIIDEPLLLVYDARALEPLQAKHYRFRQPDHKLAALRAVFEIHKLPLPDGWLRADEGAAYRELARAATSFNARGKIVEVGCWLGRSSSYVAGLCRARDLTLVCVDAWTGSSDRFDAQYRELLARRDIEAEFRRHLDALALAADVRRTTSLAAAATFEPGSVDLVFLDASHDEPAITADIAAWLPTLRAGGILAGHDYRDDHPGVVAAVDHAVAQRGLALARGPGSIWSLTALAK
jgi:predicted O-methyltransferase YrrM